MSFIYPVKRFFVGFSLFDTISVYKAIGVLFDITRVCGVEFTGRVI